MSEEQQVNMQGDDSEMVDDILKELNGEDTNNQPTNNNQMPPVQNQQMPPMHPPQMNMAHMPNNVDLQYQGPPEMNMPPEVDVEYDSNDSKINKVLLQLKKPLIVIALAFIVFNPYTNNLLVKYFPTVFNISSGTMASRQVRVVCLSLILGLLFLAINLVV
tara:strand:- start:12265 stop:12747 length:483 start_codon:yes stop_codon:yes gene_type:complete